MRGRLIGYAVLPLLLGASTLRAQGFYVESSNSNDQKGVDKTYYMPKMAKMVDADGSRITILRLDKETMYELNPQEKTYTEMTFAEMKAFMGNARASIAEMMKKRMESLPPEQRKKMEEAMASMQGKGSPSASTYEASPTGEHKSISGYDCEKYIVKRNGKQIESVWATKQVGGFESVKRDLQEWSEKAASALGTQGTALQWYNGIDGFPIQSESSGHTSTVTKVERKSIPSSEFEVPAGYKKVKKDSEGMGF